MCQNAQKKVVLSHIYSRLSLYRIQNRCYNIIDFDCNEEERAEERKESMNYDVNELEMIDLDNTANLNPDDIADSVKESENVSDNEAYLSEAPASTNLDETQVIPTPIAPVEPDMMDILGIDKSVNIDAPHDMDATDATVMVDAEEVNRMVAEAQAEVSGQEDAAETEETEAEDAESDSEETESDSEEAEAEESDEASEETDSETDSETEDIEDGEEISEEEMKELGDLEYHDEEKPVNKKPGKSGNKKKGGFFGKLSWTDYVIGAVALVVLVLGVVIISITASRAATIKELGDFAVVGSKLTSIRSLGDNTIDALVDNVKAETLEKKRLEEEAAKALEEEEKEEEEEEEEEDEEAVNVKVSFTSVEKDLKIKFTNEKTGKLITGVEFVVNVVDPKGKELTWKDTDKDGIIYEKDLVEGEYKVTIEDVEDYTFPATSTKVKVKGKIVYQAINVIDEIKSANEVNEAVEDTANGAVDTGTVSADTVAKYDDNTDLVKTNPDSDVAFTKVDISAIKAPGTAAPATRAISRATSLSPKTLGKFYAMNMSEVITASVSCGGVNVGESTQASVTVSPESTVVTAISWASSNDGVARVDGGTVNGVSAGTATITATVTLENGSTISGSCDVTVSESQPAVVGITGVNISAGTLGVEQGKTGTLTASVNQDTTLDKGITWSSNNESVATVSGGTVTGVAEGTAIITATSVGDTTKSASCTVTVTKAVVKVTGITVSTSAASIAVNGTAKVSASVAPDNATNKTYTWSSSNANVATVDAQGNVTGKGAGQADIIATAADGSGVTGKTTITVAQNVVVTVNATTCTINKDATYQIVATVTGTTNTAVTFASADSNKVKVDEKGVVTGLNVTSAPIRITVTSVADNTKVATVDVTVVNDPKLDKTTPLLDSKGNQVYVKENGKYREAKSADYYTFKEFYIKLAHNYRGWQTIDGKRYYYVEGQGGIGVPVTGEQIIGGTKWNFASDGSLAMNSTLGIDVSKWNGSIDWNAVRNSGVTFVIIRCGYRGSSTGALIKDQKFDSYIAGAEAAGLNVGLYVFSQAITEREAVEEASMAVTLASGHRISMPIFIDTEKASNGRANGLSAGERTQIMKAFCETVKSSGYTPGIYASKSWFENQLNMGELNQYRIWLAQYASQATYGGKYDMWQYTSKGSVSGISGNVDMNINLLGY